VDMKVRNTKLSDVVCYVVTMTRRQKCYDVKGDVCLTGKCLSRH
jgi:hypothetical protein